MPNTIYTHNYTYLLEYSNGMLYHGVRSCNCSIEDDAYYGSSKYTPNEIPKKTILTEHNTRKEANIEEMRYHKEVNVASSFKYYNKINAGDIWSTKLNTKLKVIKNKLNELRPSYYKVMRKLSHISNTRRYICIECREPVYINQVCQHNRA